MEKQQDLRNIKLAAFYSDKTVCDKKKGVYDLDFIIDMVENSDDLAHKIERIRNETDAQTKKRLKNSLPGVTMSGDFLDKRTKKDLISYNFIICLDFDKLGSSYQAEFFKEALQDNPHVLAAFVSVSGDGIKVLVKVEPDDSFDLSTNNTIISFHEKYAYPAVIELFEQYPYPADKACVNINRLCFLSYDNNIYVNKRAQPFLIKQNDLLNNSSKKSVNQPHPKKQDDSKTHLNELQLNEIIDYLAANKKSITSDYNSWIACCFALISEFSKETAHYYFHKISQLDDSYSPEVCDKHFNSTYERHITEHSDNRANFGYILKKAKEQGYQVVPYKNLNLINTLKNIGGELKVTVSNFSDNEQDQGDRLAVIDSLSNYVKRSEIGDAELFVELNNLVRFDNTEQLWLYFEKGKWVVDERNVIVASINEKLTSAYKYLITELYVEIETYGKASEEAAKALKTIKVVYKTLDALNTRARIDNIAKLSSRIISVTTNQFDADNYKINLLNGIYDLENHKFLEAKPEYYCKKQSNVFYQKDADCVQFKEFLSKIFENNNETIDFLQKFMGLCLTGKVEQKVMYMFGSGANGKSTLLNIIKLILGDYYQTVNYEQLFSNRNDNNNLYSTMQLYGRRLVVATEVPANWKMNEQMIKNVTETEMTGRQIYGKFTDFVSTHKVILQGNHKLSVGSQDNGIWRRLMLLPFEYTFPDNQQLNMNEVLEKVYKPELSGILNFAIEGLKKYQSEGKIIIPEKIKAATDEYKKESDILQDFFNQMCDFSPEHKIALKDFYKEYVAFCNQNNDTPAIQSSQQMRKALEERGYKVPVYGHEKKRIILGVQMQGLNITSANYYSNDSSAAAAKKEDNKQANLNHLYEPPPMEYDAPF